MDNEGHSRRSQKSSKAAENSFLQSFKTDWQMFWQGLVGDDETDADAAELLPMERLQTLSLEQLRELTRVLSADRKRLNQRLESLQKEIESYSTKLSEIRAVGGESPDTIQRINQLSDLGQSMHLELGKLNERLKVARLREDSIRKSEVRV